MTAAEDPERGLILAYAPAAKRAALAAILGLDDALGLLLRTTTQPALGQIRLAWWRDRLSALDAGEAPAEPVLLALAQARDAGLHGAALVPLVNGWEVLIEEEVLDRAALEKFGALRGGGLFAAVGALFGAKPSDPLHAAGMGWALADLARNLSEPDEVAQAREMAGEALNDAMTSRWSRSTRSLGAMAHLARLDLQLPADAPRPIGAPARVARLLWHKLSGR